MSGPVARTRAARRRLKRQMREATPEKPAQAKVAPEAQAPAEKEDNRPTREQRRQGSYLRNKPQGAREEMWINTTPDCLAALHVSGKLTDAQEQAGRDYEALWERWRGELGVSEGRSCLDVTPVGHDDTDGDARIASLMRAAARAMGPHGEREVYWTVIRGRWPRDLTALRKALDALQG